MRKKIFLLQTIFVLFIFSANAQEFISIANSVEGYTTKIKNHNDTIYLLCNFKMGTNYYLPVLYRYSKTGEKIDSIIFNRPESTFFYSMMFKNDSIYLFGRRTNAISSQDDIEMVILNNNLQILKDTIPSTNYGIIFNFFIVQDFSNHIIVYGSYAISLTNQQMKAFVLRLDLNANVTTEKRFGGGINDWMLFNLVKYNTNRYYTFANTNDYLGQTNNGSVVLTLDSVFNVIHADSVPLMTNTEDGFALSSKIYVSGKRFTGNQKFNYCLVKTDTSFNIIDWIDFGHLDTIDFPGSFKSNVFTTFGEIYVGGIINFSPNGYPYPQSPSWIQISRVDTNCNLKWNKRFGKDGINYVLWDMEATPDGGCLLACSSYDYEIGIHKRNIAVFKVDSTGNAYELIGDIPNPQNVLIYPNPASDNITIENPNFIKDKLILIYNIQGQLLIQLKLKQKRINVDISVLSKGLYIVKIKSEKGIIIKKFIKE